LENNRRPTQHNLQWGLRWFNAAILQGFAVRTGFLRFLERRASNDVADWLRGLEY
jgi:hypothetical protein